jgi:hypothetical protein
MIRLEQHGQYGHRLENPGIDVRFPIEIRYFQFLGKGQTGSGAHTALKSMGIGTVFL